MGFREKSLAVLMGGLAIAGLGTIAAFLIVKLLQN